MQSTPENSSAARKTTGIFSVLCLVVTFATAATVATLAAAQSRGASGGSPSIQILTPSVTPEEARARVKITMYSASWCGVCRAARSYFQKHGIRFVEHDVERDARAHQRHRALSPGGSLPTIQLDDLVMEGFSPAGFEKLMTAAAKSRVEQHETSGPKTFEIHWR